jgi:hypothetical protein
MELAVSTALPLVVQPGAVVPVKPSVSGNGPVADAVAGSASSVAATARALLTFVSFRFGFTPKRSDDFRLT